MKNNHFEDYKKEEKKKETKNKLYIVSTNILQKVKLYDNEIEKEKKTKIPKYPVG